MKSVLDRAPLGVVLASSIAMILIVVFANDGRHSFWLIPLGSFLVTAILADSAFLNRQSYIPRHVSKALFWLSLLNTIIVTLVAVFHGT